MDLKVVDDEGRDGVAYGQGESWMHAYSVMSVYMSDPAASAEVSFVDWYRTGDVAGVDASGYVYMVYWKKDVIFTGGVNLYSTEVEKAVMALPGTRAWPRWGVSIRNGVRRWSRSL